MYLWKISSNLSCRLQNHSTSKLSKKIVIMSTNKELKFSRNYFCLLLDTFSAGSNLNRLVVIVRGLREWPTTESGLA